MHFYKIKCPDDNKTDYLRNISCVISKTDNGISVVSGFAYLVLPMTYINVHFKLLHKVSNSYYLDFQFEYCGSLGAFAPLVNVIMDSIKKYSKNVVRTCPYPSNIRMEIINLSSEAASAVLAIVPLPRGDYILYIDVHDQNQKRIHYLSLYLSISQRKGRKKI